MSVQTAPTGTCLCGELTYSVDGPLRNILHCHCLNCQRVSGNFVASSGCATADLTIHDEQTLRWFDLGYARYGFCSTCGSSLFWQGAEHTDRTSLQAGSLLDPSGLELEGIWFVADAQSHNAIDTTVPHFDGNGDGNV